MCPSPRQPGQLPESRLPSYQGRVVHNLGCDVAGRCVGSTGVLETPTDEMRDMGMSMVGNGEQSNHTPGREAREADFVPSSAKLSQNGEPQFRGSGKHGEAHFSSCDGSFRRGTGTHIREGLRGTRSTGGKLFEERSEPTVHVIVWWKSGA
jgi:hypothetical protein